MIKITRFHFADMVSSVKYVGLNSNEDAKAILRMLRDAYENNL